VDSDELLILINSEKDLKLEPDNENIRAILDKACGSLNRKSFPMIKAIKQMMFEKGMVLLRFWSWLIYDFQLQLRKINV